MKNYLKLILATVIFSITVIMTCHKTQAKGNISKGCRCEVSGDICATAPNGCPIYGRYTCEN